MWNKISTMRTIATIAAFALLALVGYLVLSSGAQVVKAHAASQNWETLEAK